MRYLSLHSFTLRISNQVPHLSGGYISRLLLLLLLAAHERNKLLAPIWMTTSLVGLPKKSHRSQSANNNNNNTKISLQNFHLFFPTNHDERLDGCVLQRVYKNRRRISPTKQHLQETQVFFHQFLVLVVEFQARSSSHFRDFAVVFIILGFWTFFVLPGCHYPAAACFFVFLWFWGSLFLVFVLVEMGVVIWLSMTTSKLCPSLLSPWEGEDPAFRRTGRLPNLVCLLSWSFFFMGVFFFS